MASDATAGLHAAAPSRRWAAPRIAPWMVSWLQVSPLALILVVLFALPTLLFFVVSFFDYDRVGDLPGLHPGQLQGPADHAGDPAHLRTSSLEFAVIVWAITLFLGFNLAHFLVFHIRTGTTRMALFLLCAIPFWTSGIIRTIAWIPFLGRNGVFNTIADGPCTSPAIRSTSCCSRPSPWSSPTCISTRC